MHPGTRLWVVILWWVFLVVWALAALTRKRTVRKQSAVSRWVQLLLAVLVYLLVFDKQASLGPLDRPFLPDSRIFSYAGVALTAAGIGLAVWARVILGRNWSSAVTVKEGHELVRDGPYSLVRHSIYTGVLLALLGTTVAFREVRGLLGLVIGVFMLRVKSRLEESFMTEQFGGQYARYKQEVKVLIPFVW